MQKIYVLLRNDQQTGPYSLEEISQFHLQPYDLIWIEGRSAGWYYPQEIAALHPYLSFLPKQPTPVLAATSAPVFVSMPPVVEMPATSTQVRQDESFRYEPLPAAKPLKEEKQVEEEVYAQFRTEVEEPKTPQTAGLLPQKKVVGPLAVGALTVLVVGSVFAASWLLNRKAPETGILPVMQPAADVTGAETKQPTVASTEQAAGGSSVMVFKLPAKSRAALKTGVTNTTSPVPTAQNGKAPTANNQPPADAPILSTGEEQNAEETTTGTPAETTPAPQEKKKSLREKFLDLFKKKAEEKSPEEARPAEQRSGERTATRRESDADLAQLVHVRFDVPNNWMMGIKGAKATMVNRSSQALVTAIIEVQYFDEEDNLLEKRTVTFGKVDGKGSKTLSIPDHQTATKVDYTVVSVVGKPAA